MIEILRSPSFLPACIFAGIGILFVVLVSVLPVMHGSALVGGTALAIGLVVGTAVAVGLAVARLHREASENRPAERRGARI